MNRFDANDHWDKSDHWTNAQFKESPPSYLCSHENDSRTPTGGELPGESLSFGPDFASQTVSILPLHYEPNYRYPLIVWLHSDGNNENQIKQILPHISVRNFVAVGIRGTRSIDSCGHCYEWRKSPAAIQLAYENVLDAIDHHCEQFSIDATRVILAGYQGGGTMAMRIAFEAPNRFAGVVSLGGGVPKGCRSLSKLDELRNRRLPMLWQWAVESESYFREQVERDMRTAMMIKAQLEIRQYVSDDEMNTTTLSDINEWIMAKVIPGQQNQTNGAYRTTPTQFSHN
ncbi:alpha/beta hydrolase [Novipirellula aureliae]|nr:alpha/beta hydrolase-fold protein [Novipirellula aureliae]